MHKPRKSEVSGEQFKCWKKKIKTRERDKSNPSIKKRLVRKQQTKKLLT